ncbi:hypothetical protein [Hymenobacter rubidus]|uniref:hypothetical protein n=1 Tax=Hymenobacter rubidus TaxID=1441626 RepID=UPI00191DD786|nr:hypothetical protein [Hymenobacter rubidus]
MQIFIIPNARGSLASVLLVVLSWLVACSGQAQVRPDSVLTAAGQAGRPTPAPLDSAQAVQKLFTNQRRQVREFVGFGLGVMLLSPIIGLVANGIPSGTHAPSNAVPITIASLAAGSVVFGIGKKSAYTRTREKAILEAYAQGHPLPAEIRQKIIRRARPGTPW